MSASEAPRPIAPPRRARVAATALSFAATALSLATAALCLAACSTPAPAPTGPAAVQPRVAHVVIVWLKDPSDVAAREALVRATLGFESIDGVVDVQVGGPIPSEREIVDDTFDLYILVMLRDRDALDAYLAHPDHVRAGRELLAPAAARVLVYDSDVGSQEPYRPDATHAAP